MIINMADVYRVIDNECTDRAIFISVLDKMRSRFEYDGRILNEYKNIFDSFELFCSILGINNFSWGDRNSNLEEKELKKNEKKEPWEMVIY